MSSVDNVTALAAFNKRIGYKIDIGKWKGQCSRLRFDEAKKIEKESKRRFDDERKSETEKSREKEEEQRDAEKREAMIQLFKRVVNGEKLQSHEMNIALDSRNMLRDAIRASSSREAAKRSFVKRKREEGKENEEQDAKRNYKEQRKGKEADKYNCLYYINEMKATNPLLCAAAVKRYGTCTDKIPVTVGKGERRGRN